MQSDLRALYQKVILDHNLNPRHFCTLPNATHTAKGNNPLCGDHVEIFLVVDEHSVIQEASFQGAGCAISTASASLLTEAIQGTPTEEAHILFKRMLYMLTEREPEETSFEDLGELAVFENMRAYPARIKCATLSWFALEAALKQADEPISSE